MFDTGRQLRANEVNQTFTRSLNGARGFAYGDVASRCLPLNNCDTPSTTPAILSHLHLIHNDSVADTSCL